MRGIPKEKNLIVLDTGADANFTYSYLWKNNDHIQFKNLSISKGSTRTCPSLTATPAFGVSLIITTQIYLTIQIGNAKITEWFYVIPQKRSHIILGKPLLKKLHYHLSPKDESLTIQDTTIDVTHFPGISATNTLLKIEKIPFLTQLKHEFAEVFSSNFSMDLKHKFTAHISLINFPYTTPKAYFASGLRREAIRKYVDQSLENGLIKPLSPEEVVAVSPVFALQQSSEKIRIITDLRKVNKYLQFTPRPIPTSSDSYYTIHS
ncbi:Tkp3 protein [Vanderwaltozyma polyspora DSM 70294]|uniref:Tkp3 protein n=1 Tax=Vanderwaltozyma polyspora (strain ATCC 22028 / DSM 70294 / BCRC 21397 / CBS 2163 / NBRC 10782 / NRRL Y-8283 / UCD 57-17) TaxID=436907 RepID=A7TTB3_VANPO|nr:Tkp3 protein [Vanderwaltozyma polyspora DSM 70294]EDO14495.1 Tkp3 protein [Vanderwaltozyma polyspora DSM 70294]